MKTTAKMIAIIFLLGAGMWLTPQRAQAHYNGYGITYQVFYDDLSPYGTWVFNPEYGYVWVPDAGPGFTPYSTSGYWTYSVYGWTWVSYYSWGWAPFHYGRWYYDDWYGWAWVPGTDWGPGWVAWRQSEGYYGWAPLTPHIDINININWNLIPLRAWVFVPQGCFGGPHMDRYYVNRIEGDRLYRRSTFIAGTGTDRETNTRYYAGPAAREVSKATGRDIRPMEVHRETKPGQAVRDGKMQIYRPEVKRSNAQSNARPAPEKYSTYKERPRNTEPVVQKQERYTQPSQERVTPKQETYNQPRQERVTPKQETYNQPRQERVAPKQETYNQPRQERVTPKQQTYNQPRQERVTPQPQHKATPQSQSKGTVDRKAMPPVKQNSQADRGARPEPRQKEAPSNKTQKAPSGGHSKN